jgi:hypothetical protein
MALLTGLARAKQAHLREHLTLLLEADEPEAFLGSLARLVEIKAFGVVGGRIEADEAEVWSRLSEILTRVRLDLA